MSSQTESAKETLPWGVTAQGINTLYKLHGRGMNVCKHKTKDKKQLGSMLGVADRCINMLCRVSKGMTFFSSFFLLFFKRYYKRPLLRLLECLRYPFYIIDWKAEATTTVWHNEGFSFFFFKTTWLPHWQERHTQKNKTKTQQQSILKIALVLPFLCFSPNHTNNV